MMKRLTKNTHFNFVWLLLLPAMVISCSNPDPVPIDFYYWKSEFSINSTEKETFEALQSNKLYIRLFDVDKLNATPEPKGIIRSFDSDVLQAEYVPVVFITNKVFQGVSHDDNKKLAADIWALVNDILSKNKHVSFDELQIDCDWTQSTKRAFFNFLEQLKGVSQKKITSTLRLHQAKDKELMGIPPVDKVYLMAYATSSPVEDSDLNSILDSNLLQNYLQTINDYPLEFDIALPLYSWGIITNHLGKKKLINGVSHQDLEGKEYRKLGAGIYEIQKDVFLRGIWLNKGFVVKVEMISPELLGETKSYLRKTIKRPYGIVYYHLDSLFTHRFSVDELK
ncbi:hypothetical protein MM239_00665 [Belliella sp. DSM 111904]|uniref:Glycoside hydrolase Family 18, chitinase_18 n=1 Tax=Belliella filtrata TaxID=2923435 RepID=A0ABS9UUP7_9BACT|nr:hypothetical protein [Belliella filtrata]MCH7407892.1 hypothetical protein [Belliella filtrata]